MIKFKITGKYRPTITSLKRAKNFDFTAFLHHCAQRGVEALAKATPVDTGKTAESWGYKIQRKRGRTIISWTNSNIVDRVIIAVILQYGHATRGGSFVEGRDYINPAIRPIFDNILFELDEYIARQS